MANWPWSTDQPRPAVSDQDRRSVWLLRATAPSFSCPLGDFRRLYRNLCVCAQVPRDTGRLSALPSDLISALIFGVRAVLGSMMYLRRGYTVNTTFFGHHQSRESRLSRSSPSSHRTAGGPRKLVLGVASAMGNNRGVFIPPSFPSLSPHRNLY